MSPNLRLGRKIHILEDNLLRSCSKSAREKIEAKQQEHFEHGMFLSTQEKINIASRSEEIENYVPEYDIKVNLDENNDTTNSMRFATLCHNEAVDKNQQIINPSDVGEDKGYSYN